MKSLPDLLLPKKKYFGLSIERARITAVELDTAGKPMHSYHQLLPDDTFEDGNLKKKEQFFESVRHIYINGKFSTPYVSVCFPEVFAFTRGCALSRTETDEISDAITWRIKDLFPFPQNDIYYDWKLLSSSETDHQTIVVAIQKKLLDDLVDVLVRVGLKPLRFEPDASALVRLLQTKNMQKALLVEVNPKGAYITLVDGEKAVFTTVINNTKDDTPASYLSNIDQTIQEITGYYSSKGILDASQTQVAVTGDMASVDWVNHLGTILHYPTTLLPSPLKDQKFNKAFVTAYTKIAPPSDFHTINLLPTVTQQFYDLQSTLHLYRTIIVRTGIICCIATFLSFLCYITVTVKNRQTENEVARVRSASQQEMNDTQSLLLLNAQAKNIIQLAPLRKTPARTIESFYSLLDESVSISAWEYDDARLSYKISGVAKTRDALIAFKQRLEASDNFANISLPLDSLESPVNSMFMMTFQLQ